MSHTVEQSSHEDANGTVVTVSVHQYYEQRSSLAAEHNGPMVLSTIRASTTTHPHIPEALTIGYR